MELTKNKKIALYIAIALVITAIAYYVFQKKKKKAIVNPTATPNETSAFDAATEAVPEQLSSVFPLKLGKSGDEVEQLQLWLLKKHGVNLPSAIRGEWEDLTDDVVKRILKKDTVSKEYFFKTGMHTINLHK